jgi:hypothetical protein
MQIGSKIGALLALTVSMPNAVAESCTGIDDLEARLACFDRTATCASIESAEERLACYEGRPKIAVKTPDPIPVEQPAQVIPEPSSAKTQVVSDEEGVSKVDADNDAFPIRGQTSSTDESQIFAVITHVRKNPQGIVYLDLDNGQVWKETTRTKFRYKTGLKVTITNGSLGSVQLHAEGMKKYAKVARVN